MFNINKYKQIKPVIKWLIVGPLRQAKTIVVQIMTYQAISTLFQVVAFMIMIRFVNMLFNDWSFSFLQYSYDFSEQKNTVFWMVFFGVVSLLLAGSSFSYLARKKTAYLARKTEDDVMKRLTQEYVDTFHEKGDNLRYLPDHQTLMSFYNRGGRFLGRTAMAVASSLIPLVVMLASVFFLFYFKPFLTFLLLMILALACPIFVHLAFRARNISLNLMKHARQATLDKNSYLDYLRRSPNRPSKLEESDFHWVIGTESIRNFMDAYESRLKITALSTYFTQVLIAVMLVSIMLAVIYPVVQGADFAVTNTLAFIVSFKFFGSGLIAVVSTFVLLNVFYTYCQDMVPFLERSALTTNKTHKDKEKNELNYDKKIVFHQGQPLAVNYTLNVDWSNIKLIVNSLDDFFKKNNIKLPNEYRILSPNFSFFDDNYLRKFCSSNKDVLKILDEDLPNIKGFNKKHKLQLDFFKKNNFSAYAWNTLSNEIKYLFLAMKLRQEGGTKLIFIEGATFINQPKNWQLELFSRLNKHFLMVVFPGGLKLKKIDSSFFNTFACITTNGLMWIGDFSEAKVKNINVELFMDIDKNFGTMFDDFEEL